MRSDSSDVAQHVALLAEDIRDGTGLDVEPRLAAMARSNENMASAGDVSSAYGAMISIRSEAEAALATGFCDLSVNARGRATPYVGTPLSFLAACWAVARAAMPSLPHGVDAAVFATERAALTGWRPTPPFSAGGACRALHAADGWWALSLARPEDVELVPAFTGLPVDDPWQQLEYVSARQPVAPLVDLARELGLPASAVGTEVAAGTARPFRWTWADAGPAPVVLDALARRRRWRILDLTGLWAGPLCGSLLARAGHDVVKVESTRRPDGARTGEASFFHLMNAHKRCIALDFDRDREVLAELISKADVVLEGSRPEALRAKGIDAADVAARGGVWVRLSAYATQADPRMPSRVGFGDDVALGAGLRVDTAPSDAIPAQNDVLPCGDALADPLSGIAALAAVSITLRALVDGVRTGGCLLEVPMVQVAARAAHVPSTAPVGAWDGRITSATESGSHAGSGGRVALGGRTVDAQAQPLGADTATVLREWCGRESFGG